MKTLRELRIEKKLKQIEVATTVGISQNYYSKIENSKKVPSVSVIRKIAGVLGEEVVSILMESENIVGGGCKK